MATSFSASLRSAKPRRVFVVLAIVAVLIAVWTTTHRASSANSTRRERQIVLPKQFTAPNTPASTPPLAKKVWAVVDGTTGQLIRGSHATAATGGSRSRYGAGIYIVTFDRHVDNCALVAGLGADGTFLPDEGPLADRVSYAVLGNYTSSVDINTAIFDSGGTPGREALADSDFHIIGLCPST
jgi:hypothetical protein